MNWSRSHPGYEGEKLRVYSLDLTHWKRVGTILQRRQAKREQLQKQQLDIEEGAGSPVRFKIENAAGDPGEEPSAEPDPWLTKVALSDVMGLIEASGYDPEVMAEIQQVIPEYVFEKLKLFPHSP